jgi:hypothetical protein
MNCLRFSRKLLAPILLGGTSLAIACGNAQAAAPLQASCHLQSAGNKIRRVVYLQFDNVHLRRDNPNVPSDLVWDGGSRGAQAGQRRYRVLRSH